MKEDKVSLVEMLLEWMRENEEERYSLVKDFVLWSQRKLAEDDFKELSKLLSNLEK